VTLDADVLVAEAVRRHGVRVDRDDPAMLVATLAAVAVRDALVDVPASCARAIDAAAATVAAEGSKVSQAEIRKLSELAATHMKRALEAPSRTANQYWVAIGVMAGAMLFIAGVLVGATF
jgi:hypothetical protein